MLWERLLTARDPRKAEISAGTPYVARRVFAPVGAKKGYPRCCLSLTVVRFGPDEPLCVLNDLSYKARPGEWWESCGTRGMPLALWGEYAAFIADCDEEMRALRVAGKL